MTGRRSHERFSFPTPVEGSLQVMRQVVVERGAGGELALFSLAPASAGEEMGLDMAGAGRHMSLRVRVRHSRPVLLNGAVRHRVSVEVIEREAAVDVDLTPAGSRA